MTLTSRICPPAGNAQEWRVYEGSHADIIALSQDGRRDGGRRSPYPCLRALRRTRPRKLSPEGHLRRPCCFPVFTWELINWWFDRQLSTNRTMGENMRYLWVVVYYACSKGHPNQFDMYFSSKTGEVNRPDLKYRLPHELPCSSCPSGIVSGRVPLEMRLH